MSSFAYWTFGYNVPLVMNLFIYLMMILIVAVAIATGIFAARSFKKAEAHMPVNADYEKKLAARRAKKAKSAKVEKAEAVD
ncbi:MAG: hypothetical protein FWG78_02875 [Coriobacteriia bacterium]|nr:hypothetical protein [Coriobacteriia bacterium]